MEMLKSKDFDALIAKEPLVLVDFFATWCGPCKMLAPVLEELAAKLAGKVRIVKVDVDENNDLAMRFQIMSVPTMILFQNGKAVKQIQGYQPAAALETALKPYYNDGNA